MAGLSKQSIKKMVEKYSGAKITNDAADAIASAVETYAREMCRKAVKNAKQDSRNVIKKKDIKVYG